MDLTILMPCLNESETLSQCIRKAQTWAAGSGVETEIVVADNGSTDNSPEIATSLGARVVAVSERGYGAALRAGCAEARGRWIILGDADDSYDFSDLDAFVEALREGCDLVIGNRFQGGIAPRAMPWKNRYIGNPSLSWMGRRLFGISVGDFHCGLRGLTKEAFERLDLRTTGMEFASEMVIKAAQHHLLISEVPTTLSQDGRSRPPHLRPWRDGWRHLRFMALFSPRWLFVIPGGSMLAAAGLLYLRLLLGPWKIGGTTLDVHTMFFAQAGICLGLLFVLTGVVARALGTLDGSFEEQRYLKPLLGDFPTAEVGALVGGLSVALGLFWGISATAAWYSKGFGPLAGDALLRTISLATLLLTTGGIVFTYSLLLGFIQLPTRASPIPSVADESKDMHT
ncbi:MAG: hypothetical protein QOH37_225 [Nocardioidaceae bacterium]|nr:hypothetical protein [Nocardioidaceae bacterium]